MRVKNTGSFDYNIRRGTVPSLSEEDYVALIEDGAAEVSEETAEYLQLHGYAVGEDNGIRN